MARPLTNFLSPICITDLLLFFRNIVICCLVLLLIKQDEWCRSEALFNYEIVFHDIAI